MQKPHRMPMHMHLLNEGGMVDKTKRHRVPRLTEKSGAAANPLAATPFSFQYKGGVAAAPGGLNASIRISTLRAACSLISRAEADFAQASDWRQGRALVSRGLEAKKNTVRLIVAKQGHIRIGAGVRGRSNMTSKRAPGPSGMVRLAGSKASHG